MSRAPWGLINSQDNTTLSAIEFLEEDAVAAWLCRRYWAATRMHTGHDFDESSAMGEVEMIDRR